MLADICPCRLSPSVQQSGEEDVGLDSKSDVMEQQNINKAYSECCQPYHTGIKNAQDAETLMRSRYSAFVKQNVAYIIETTLPAQQSLLDKQAIEIWAKETDWAGLEVVAHIPKISKRHSQVTFKAYYRVIQNMQLAIDAHQERSTFVKAKSTPSAQDKRWYFLDPTVELRVTQKQPCICGSGEKFKRCCGPYLE